MVSKQDFEEFLYKLKQASEEKIIVVEGIKDKKALNSFGITNVMTLKKPLYKVIEIIAAKYKDCIILTDLDSEGKKLYAKLNSKLPQFGVRIDNSFRNFLFKTKLRQIEGIKTYFEKLE